MRCISKRSALLLFAALSLSAFAHAAQPTAQEATFSAGALHITRITLTDGAALPVRDYLSKAAQKAPLVLYIQGSGCVPPFVGLGTAAQHSTIYS